MNDRQKALYTPEILSWMKGEKYSAQGCRVGRSYETPEYMLDVGTGIPPFSDKNR
jgi:hypothetical protein